MTRIYLSHFLSDETPGFGGNKIFHCDESSSIKKGKSSNSVHLHFINHSSTHIDLPRHFDDKGKTLSDYPADFWFFKKCHLIEYTAKESEIIDIESLDFSKMPRDVEFLIIKTGFEKKRQEKVFWNDNPGFSPKLGHYLRDNYPSLKAIGFDSISLTAFQNRELGREAHRAFLCAYKDKNTILIIEDMHLIELHKSPATVMAGPLMLKEADGVPITLIAEL